MASCLDGKLKSPYEVGNYLCKKCQAVSAKKKDICEPKKIKKKKKKKKEK